MDNIKELKKKLEKTKIGYGDYPYSESDIIQTKIDILESVVRNLKKKIKNLKRYDGYKGRLNDLIKEIEYGK